jgi:hypothetical protein
MARTLVLLASLAFICLLVFLTVRLAVNEGINFRVILTLPLLILLGVGVLGALNSPPPDE